MKIWWIVATVVVVAGVVYFTYHMTKKSDTVTAPAVK